MRMSNYTPGFVESVDRATRICRVRIPGVTDGAELFPEAMLSYPLGDKSEHTEIRIVQGDRVWLDFVNGDPRFPIITGFRPKETDNAMAWRRWHHDNIELQADTDMRLLATGAGILIEAGTTVIVRAPAIRLEGNTTCTGTMTVQQLLTYQAGIAGTGMATSNGKNVSDSHNHVPDSRGDTQGPVA